LESTTDVIQTLIVLTLCELVEQLLTPLNADLMQMHLKRPDDKVFIDVKVGLIVDR
jgi:hypothetical protein